MEPHTAFAQSSTSSTYPHTRSHPAEPRTSLVTYGIAGPGRIDPEYQGHGIAGHLVGMVKERYRDYLYIEVMPEESKNATFYQKHGFSIMEDGAAMQIRNPGERR